jgi:hypothetical protein
MTDLERRLREALHSVSHQAPPGLAEAVARRHRRHRTRLAAGTLAVVAAAALAAPALASALSARSGHVATHGSSTRPHQRAAGHRAAPLRAAPGTVLSGCNGSADGGQVGPNWRANVIGGTGPIWFNNGGHSRGPIRLYVSVVVLTVRPGSAIIVRVAPAGRPYLRFLYGPRDSMNPGTRYSMRSGESGVTFAGCNLGPGAGGPAGVTNYYGGFLVKGARCVPVQAWIPGRARPVLFHLGACARH